MNGKRRIAIVGLGDIAKKVYAPLLAWNDAVEVAGVMSRSQSTVDAVMRQYRFPAGTTRLDELLSWDIDAVFVHSPTETHYEIVKACLDAGKAVYVDKPISYDYEQSVRLAALAETKGLLLGVGFNRRFAPMYREANRWLAESGTSSFEYATFQKHRTRQQSHAAKLTVYDDLIHMLDLIVWLGGSEWTLQSGRLSADDKGRLRHAAGIVSFEGGASATYSMARGAGIDLETMELHGGGKSAIVTNMETAMLFQTGTKPQTKSFGSWETVWERRGFAGVVDHFLRSIHRPEQCEIRADLVLPTHLLAEKLCN